MIPPPDAGERAAEACRFEPRRACVPEQKALPACPGLDLIAPGLKTRGRTFREWGTAVIWSLRRLRVAEHGCGPFEVRTFPDGRYARVSRIRSHRHTCPFFRRGLPISGTAGRGGRPRQPALVSTPLGRRSMGGELAGAGALRHLPLRVCAVALTSLGRYARPNSRALSIVAI
jgi:hypothetical protein